MKREIKFRAWSRTGEWDEEGEKRQFEMIGADNLAFYCADLLKNLLKDSDDDFYIMQFTGIKDKNGVDIYEGDIVKSGVIEKVYKDMELYHGIFAYPPPYIGKVEWFNNYSCYAVRYAGPMGLFDFSNISMLKGEEYTTSNKCLYDAEITVIGNIYENTELLRNDQTNA